MELFKNGIPVYEYNQSYGGKNILVSIDSSKSNTAMFVWDEYGYPIDDYEISGAGSDIDVYDLCWQTRIELEKLFRGSNILRVGIEDIITKKEDGYKGLEIHQSRHKITAVFDNLIFFFQIYHNQTPRRINNWEWKSHVLPEEFRSKSHKKGSKDWCAYMGNRWANRKDDVTDAYCIGLYLLMTEKIESVYKLESTEPAKFDYDYGIFPTQFPVPVNAKNFLIKNSDTLIHNIETVANYIKEKQPGCIKVPMEMLTIDDVYGDKLKFNKVYKFDRSTDEVLVVVYRSS